MNENALVICFYNTNRGPNIEKSDPVSTDNASWRGPNIEKLNPNFYRQCKLGRAQTQKLTESQLTFHKLKLMFIVN
ncbi:hypothetical protein SA19142_20850 [Staphylococcus argenteus]|nr:hypothetical protein SARG0275_24550 [Staphylococcus argenteus]GJF37341.1 hypothetical protein SA19023_20960 [Staphylococcus argenteus]GJF70885.1 hypothetical protein SA19142_20850 [Staphylococcus argenteus]GJF81237.1 hypothetical protein SA19252_22000 [Staphylococcus argenteus]GJF91333.1 hypothetical protein SASC090_19420 [Staphylococcus argenteus]